jgi:hypothetical protein
MPVENSHPALHRMKFVECIVQFRGFRERRNVREM